MQRAYREKRRTRAEWRRRPVVAATRKPGYFRKRKARGCPRPCETCLARKARPTRQETRSQLAFQEGLALLEFL